MRVVCGGICCVCGMHGVCRVYGEGASPSEIGGGAKSPSTAHDALQQLLWTRKTARTFFKIAINLQIFVFCEELRHSRSKIEKIHVNDRDAQNSKEKQLHKSMHRNTPKSSKKLQNVLSPSNRQLFLWRDPKQSKKTISIGDSVDFVSPFF